MKLKFDPGDNEKFWQEISQLPGFPRDDQINLKRMVFERDALSNLPQILDAIGILPSMPILAVMDPTPMRRGKESLKPLVTGTLQREGWEVRELVLEPTASGQVHTDENQIEVVKAQLSSDLGVLSIGSGTVTDITKHACYLYEQETGIHMPYVVYQTANSVSAYTSNMAPVFVQGVKRTLSSRYPDALVCDLETLRDAPREMTVAGVGDMLAAFVSLPDWYLANRLGMDDSYSQLTQALMGPLDEIFLAYSDEIRDRSLAGMELLAKLISLAGLSMSLSHATTPLSGYEHVISHVLDMTNEHRGKPLAQHGSQVALAAILASAAYQKFLEQFDPSVVDLEKCFSEAEDMRSRIMAEFSQVDPTGKAGQECWSDYAQKLEKWHSLRGRLPEYLSGWEEIKRELRSLARPPGRLVEILKRIDAPLHFMDLEPPINEEEAKFAFFNAPLMRKRLTLGDVLIYFGWDRQTLWDEIMIEL